LKLNPPNELPEKFKGIERHDGGEFYYSYNVHSFAWISAKYHTDGLSDGLSYTEPGIVDFKPTSCEVSLNYEGHKPLVVFCYSKVEIDDALRRCWEDLGVQIRLKVMVMQGRLEVYEALDTGYDDLSFWQRLDKG
jgi:hypothetical protein